MSAPIRLLAALWLGAATAGLGTATAGAAGQTFVDLTEGDPGLADNGIERGLAWGDYDGDGDPDLFLAVLRGPDRLFRNDGHGSFLDVAPGLGLADPGDSVAPAWLDFDRDGDLDLYLARVGPNWLYRNQDGRFERVDDAAGAAGEGLTWAVAPADFDGDGWTDLFAVDFTGNSRLYRNVGGRFEDLTEAAGLGDSEQSAGAAWGDFDGDGRIDLYVSGKTGANRLWQNRGDGTFVDRAAELGLAGHPGSVGCSWADADGDGDLDLFVSRDQAPNLFFVNDGRGRFEERAAAVGLAHPGSGRGMSWGDVDLDGDLDLFLAVSDGPNQLYLNDAGRFLPVAEASGLADAGTGTAGVWADFDGDGDLDLALSSAATDWRLYRQESTPAGHWLQVFVEDRSGGPAAPGASVEVFAGGRVWRRTHGPAAGYQGLGPHEVHFGLGAAAAVDSVRVAAPGLGSVVLGSPGIDRAVRVRVGPPPTPARPHKSARHSDPGGDGD